MLPLYLVNVMLLPVKATADILRRYSRELEQRLVRKSFEKVHCKAAGTIATFTVQSACRLAVYQSTAM